MARTSDRYVSMEFSYSASQGARGNLRTLRDHKGERYGLEGVVRTPLGMVRVAVYDGEPRVHEWRDQYVYMAAMIDGVEYVRSEARPPSAELTETGLTTVAHRWIRDLHDNLST